MWRRVAVLVHVFAAHHVGVAYEVSNARAAVDALHDTCQHRLQLECISVGKGEVALDNKIALGVAI